MPRSAAERPGARDSPWDRPENIAALPRARPKGGWEGEAAGRRENRRGVNRDAGREASTDRFATRVRSCPSLVGAAAPCPWASPNRARRLGEGVRGLRDCPDDYLSGPR